MKPEPTLPQKIATLRTLEECDGFEDQLAIDGKLTGEAKTMIAVRRLRIRTK